MQSIRRAERTDSSFLTTIVRTSHAYVGRYRAMVKNIDITSEQIEKDSVYVCEINERIVGFYSLLHHGEEAELDFLFVDNDFQGYGIGRFLFQHMLQVAKRQGFLGVEIVAHPPSEAFYAKMGAVTVGSEPPKGGITWSRPRMWIVVP